MSIDPQSADADRSDTEPEIADSADDDLEHDATDQGMPQSPREIADGTAQ